jgi:multicomponent Na+:H+ antiporter subunit G
VAVKLVMVGVLIFFASPTATHALARAAMVRGLKPLRPDALPEEESRSSTP